MENQVLLLFESITLVIALSLDAFVASFAYGTNKIKVPALSAVVIDAICTLTLAISLFFGTMLRPFIPQYLTKVMCFGILFILGLMKLCENRIKAMINKGKSMRKKVSFSLMHINFILNVYTDPKEADVDASKTLSPTEAASLSLALSLDGLAIGFGTAFGDINYTQIIIFSLIANMLAVALGCFIGNHVAKKIPMDLSWLSGALLIVLAISKIMSF